MNVDTVLYDWGGVFQRTIDHAPRQELARELAVDELALERRVFDHPAMVEASLGKLPAAAAWQRVMEDLGYRGDMLGFITRFFAGDRLDQRLVSLVIWQRAHGQRVGLLSNAPESISTAQGIAGRWGVDGVFEAQVFSYQIGVSKPHPLAFEAALRTLGVKAQQVVFVDDIIENVRGAEAAGLNALLFRNVEKLLTDLHGLGLCVPEYSELI
ncbi:MAG: HAD family phosphatase [Chloroflexi bacterium]|nr:HAD family phosphatase [Chloroflexota bacterium]